jgi:hypothetical protein
MIGLVAITYHAPQAAQPATKASAPKPPPVVMMAPPAPPPPLTVVPLAPPAPAPVSYGPAPKAAPALPIPADPKAAKDQAKAARKAREADGPACANREALKPWMLKTMVAACDRLLAMPTDPATPWSWRAELLQNRALALVNGGDLKNAIDAIDESDAIGASQADPLFDLSTGIGNKMIRAYIMGRRGETKAARELLAQVRQLRPWSTTVVAGADAIELSMLAGDSDEITRRIAARSRIDPDVARMLIYLNLMRGDLKGAADMGSRVSMVDPRMRGGWTLQGGGSEEENLRNRVRIDCTKAYLAAALGDRAGSAAQFAAIEQFIAGYVGPDPRNVDPQLRPDKSLIKRFEERLAIATKLRAMITDWQDVSARRDSFEEKDFKALSERFKAYPNGADLLPALFDQGRVLLARQTGKEASETKLILDGFLRGMTGSLTRFTPDDLGKWAPRAENLDQVPRFASSASKWLFSDGSGYSQSKEGEGDIRTVRYETLVGTRSLVEEMLLLAAANYARQEGRDGFVILSNRTLGRRTTIGSYYGGGTTYESGVEAQARIMLVNTAALPAELAGSADRVITVAEVERDLKPRYDGYMARKDAIAAAKKKK